MAVVSNNLNSRLQLKLNTGNDEKGNAIIKTKSLSNLKSNAQDEDVMDVAVVVADLQEHVLSKVIKVSEDELVNE